MFYLTIEIGDEAICLIKFFLSLKY